MKILMCPPRFYTIDYEINPWMEITNRVDPLSAAVQWRKLYEYIEKCGVEIETIEPVSGLPDMVFTANAGLILENQFFSAHFKHRVRQRESHYFKQWFIKAGYDVPSEAMTIADASFEGEGDALFAGNKLFVGYGIRSDREYYHNLGKIKSTNNQPHHQTHFHSRIDQIIYCELTNFDFYHLDTCFCPLNATQALWFPDAFTEPSQNAMKEAIELIPVPKKEAMRFACNAVVIDRHIIMPTGCPETVKLLESMDYQVYTCAMSEFMKAGGACKCLTLFI